MRLEGRIAVVTGASRGVGRSVALALAREGCDLVLGAKTVAPHPKLPGTITEVAAEVEQIGRKALAVATDVREVDQIENLAEQAISTFGRIDILINNAGAAWWQPIESTPPKRFDLVMDVNCKGPFFLAQAVLPHMRKNGWGHIVNMSPPIHPPMAEGKIAYMISKFGMSLLSVGLAAEVRDDNIAVNSLWPVTLVESAATIHLGLGKPEDWRKPEILADATVAIVTSEPSSRTGETLIDEDVLRDAGVTDFDSYACVAGATPQRIPW